MLDTLIKYHWTKVLNTISVNVMCLIGNSVGLNQHILNGRLNESMKYVSDPYWKIYWRLINVQDCRFGIHWFKPPKSVAT